MNDQQSAQIETRPLGSSNASTVPTTPATGTTAPTPAQTTPATRNQTGQPAATDEQLTQAEDLYAEAELYLLNQRFQRAAHTLDQAIAINPNLAEAYTLRGFARTAGNPPAAPDDGHEDYLLGKPDTAN